MYNIRTKSKHQLNYKCPVSSATYMPCVHAQMKSRCRLRISLRHTGQRDRRRLHLRHMHAWPQGIRATCTARTMHTLQSRPGTPGGPSPLGYLLWLAASSCFSGMSSTVSAGSSAERRTVQNSVLKTNFLAQRLTRCQADFQIACIWHTS